MTNERKENSVLFVLREIKELNFEEGEYQKKKKLEEDRQDSEKGLQELEYFEETHKERLTDLNKAQSADDFKKKEELAKKLQEEEYLRAKRLAERKAKREEQRKRLDDERQRSVDEKRKKTLVEIPVEEIEKPASAEGIASAFEPYQTSTTPTGLIATRSKFGYIVGAVIIIVGLVGAFVIYKLATKNPCGEGTRLSEGKCIPIEKAPTVITKTKIVEKVIKPAIACGEGTKLIDGKCVAEVAKIEPDPEKDKKKPAKNIGPLVKYGQPKTIVPKKQEKPKKTFVLPDEKSGDSGIIY